MRNFILAICAFMVASVSFATTEYVLINVEEFNSVNTIAVFSAQDGGLKIGKPAKFSQVVVTEDDAKCGYKDDGLGGFEDDSLFDGTAHGISAVITGQSDWVRNRIIDLYLIGETPANRSSLTAWTLLLSGETCTETIGGENVIFYKFSATCAGCSA